MPAHDVRMPKQRPVAHLIRLDSPRAELESDMPCHGTNSVGQARSILREWSLGVRNLCVSGIAACLVAVSVSASRADDGMPNWGRPGDMPSWGRTGSGAVVFGYNFAELVYFILNCQAGDEIEIALEMRPKYLRPKQQITAVFKASGRTIRDRKSTRLN